MSSSKSSPITSSSSSLGASLWTNLGLRPGEMAGLPPRIARLMEAEELASERVISWVQLFITMTFAVLYLLAPRPIDAAMRDEPVPWALGIYLTFTLIRLALAYRGTLPGWFLVLSMMADITLLYSLIWQFHIAYEQPPGFSLRVPTFTHVFIFIAVRALRFDPRFVLWQGLFAAFGWVGIVVLAIWQAGPGSVTRSFISYMNGEGILIGAEMDKLITLFVVTAVLTGTLYRARVTLLTAVREGVATRQMRRYFGAGVADHILGSRTFAKAGDAEAREAAVLMLDLRGFTPFATTVEPGAAVAVLTAFHRRIIPIIEANGGTVDKFLGDGAMATFGAVRPSKTAAADAMRALVAVMAIAPQWLEELSANAHPPLAIKGAVAAGPVVAATLGTDERLEFTLIGSAVNLAAKLEKHNKAAGTVALTTAETYKLARAQGFEGTGEALPPQKVAGIAQPLHLVKLA